MLQVIATTMVCATMAQGGWETRAPEQLPQVTVRWEDPGLREVFVVEGARYQARVATQPARVLSLRVDGRDLLGEGGLSFGFSDAAGRAYEACPAELRPEWQVFRGQRWVAATDSRARMNVWSATPYYWDAHLLDIPLVTSDYAAAAASEAQGPPLVEWRFESTDAGWRGLHECDAALAPEGWRLTATGGDPYVVAPPVDIPGSVRVAIRARCSQGGGAAIYWGEGAQPGFSGERVTTFSLSGDGQWHDYLIDLPTSAPLKALRLDPPGGTTELSWVRVVAVPERDPSVPPPVRGEVIFHAHPDELRIELRTDPNEGQPAPTSARLEVEGAATTLTELSGRGVLRYGEAGSTALLLCPEGGAIDGAGAWTAALTGDRPGAVWVLRPEAPGESPEEAFAEELAPLGPEQVEVRDGHWLGYDHAAGLYRMQADTNLGAFGFEQTFVNPGRRAETAVRLRNGERARRMTVKCLTGIGNLEAAVLTDDHGFPLPTPAFVAKNFAGEMEEPDDSAFGDSYFPLELAAGEDRSFRVLHVNQLWGNHLLKQVSSIRFFCIYWHLSTGASETTCFTHNWLEYGRSGAFTIPDFRPLSGPFWPGQPQHGCEQWPGFLQYNGGRSRLIYERTEFESISPCLARFTAHYHTSDNAATASVGITEIPQKDEMRTFVRLRYDWTNPVEIEGDPRESFRWMNLYEFATPPTLLYTDAAGATRHVEVTPGAPMLLGEPLSTETPFVASHASGERYGCVALVRSFRARLGGVETDQAAVSAQFAPDNGCWWLTVPRDRLTLQPGDWLEAEVMLMPHGEPSPPGMKPERERTERFGMGLPRTTVAVGEKLADFPARVRADDEVAACTIEGGFEAMPLIAEGFRGWGVPLLWREGIWQDQQTLGGDGYQVEPDGQGGYRFIFVYPIRRGQTIPLLVTRAECSTGISRLVDRNGYPQLEAPEAGRFRLKAPILFGPGTNTIAPGAPAIEFEGDGVAVRGLPLSVEAGQPTTVEVDETGRSLVVRGGPAAVRFTGLRRGGSYMVSVDGAERAMTAVDGSLRIELPGPESRVVLREG